VAVWPPDDVLDRVAAVDRPVVPGLRWTTRGQWHVTLRFLGPVDDVEAVVTALAGVEAPPATARLGPTVGRFGQRILHVPVAGLDAIAEAAIAATAGVGRPPEDRAFAGHLTLARVSRDASVDLRRLAGTPLDCTWDVEETCLVESRLSPAGARYEVLERFALGNR